MKPDHIKSDEWCCLQAIIQELTCLKRDEQKAFITSSEVTPTQLTYNTSYSFYRFIVEWYDEETQNIHQDIIISGTMLNINDHTTTLQNGTT